MHKHVYLCLVVVYLHLLSPHSKHHTASTQLQQCMHLQVLSKFSRLRHIDMSYSVAPGSLSDVADVMGQLPELQQLHLRGLGLTGPFSCDLLNTTR
jgi:hypothetical protein